MQRELQIRPLSEGIGLGCLKSISPKPVDQFIPQVELDRDLPKVPEFESIYMHQAHAAYAPQSVAAEIRERSTSKLRFQLGRFFAGAGTDIFVGCLTAFILAWAGIIAWNAGSSNGVNPLEAWVTLVRFLTHLNFKQMVLGLLVLSLSWRLIRVGISKI